MHTITNTTANVIYVGLNNGGSVAVMPGESRPFHIAELAPAWKPDPVAAEAAASGDDAGSAIDAEVADLRKATATDLIGVLAGLDQAVLVRLGEAEQVDKHPRKTLLSAIGEEQLRRAEAESKAAEELAKANAAANLETQTS